MGRRLTKTELTMLAVAIRNEVLDPADAADIDDILAELDPEDPLAILAMKLWCERDSRDYDPDPAWAGRTVTVPVNTLHALWDCYHQWWSRFEVLRGGDDYVLVDRDDVENLRVAMNTFAPHSDVVRKLIFP